MPYAYMVGDEAVELSVDPDVIAVRFRDRHPLSARTRAARAWSAGKRVESAETADEEIILVPVPLLQRQPTPASEDEAERTIRRLREEPDVESARPVFRIGSRRAFAADRVVVGLHDVAHSARVSRRYDLGVTEIRDDKMVCQHFGTTETLPLVAAMASDDEVRFAEPDFVTIGRQCPAPNRVAPRRPPNGQSVTVLATTIANSQKPISANGTEMCPFTARIGPSQLSGGGWMTTNTTVARSINWARKAGADILINRWGGGLPSFDIIEEFERARMLGRGGLGCVIVVAAPKGESSAGFPATLPDVLSVAGDRIDDDPPGPGMRRRTNGGRAAIDFEAVHHDRAEAIAPAVSGACALVLAANPALTEAQVRRLVRDTIGKRDGPHEIGADTDDFEPDRLDMVAAIQSALAMAI